MQHLAIRKFWRTWSTYKFRIEELCRRKSILIKRHCISWICKIIPPSPVSATLTWIFVKLGNSQFFFFFFLLSGFSFTDTDNSQDSRVREGTIFFHSTTSTLSRTFRHLFATLHVRWLSYIFNRTACIYQTATRWDLPPYRIARWLTDDMMLIFVCLIVDLLLQLFDMRNWWARTRIDYLPCITSETTRLLAFVY